MICQQLRQLCEMTARCNPFVNRGELVRLACQACRQLDVCPALSTDEFDARSRLYHLPPRTRKRKSSEG
jgi:hypothetical protein